MTPENLAILIIGGLGALLLVIGIGIAAAQKNKIRHCTKMTAGRVIRHRYHGDGRVNPMIEYEVEGQMYTVARKFRGIITKTRISPGKLYEDSGAYVTEKDYLYIPRSAVTNIRQMAQDLWPIGSSINVYYNPLRPKEAYAEKIPAQPPAETRVFAGAGIGLVILSFIIAFFIAS
ncbi:DUF3592 domain-containing protein [[Clostridium] scindens]|jgi:hypothetical protein|uniref:DUF3592 domain-containing protein n=1 Tax=Clostridium scindens (strain JCM 10418 / VPI 12708) TaxID=29347 RepID=UPI001D07B0F4|nr:DUF3592 domain-containing protein [[Clostridium] scindens]MCB6891363.1 hypothetical protein [[Clostridium] scindens]